MITDKPIETEKLLADLSDPDCGAVVVFAGIVRADEKDGKRVSRIHYDCYREMAQQEMSRVTEEIKGSSGVKSIRAVHRIGDVPVGEVSLLVVVASGHRGEGYDASRRVVDEIKKRVPIWKKEVYDDESSRWL